MTWRDLVTFLRVNSIPPDTPLVMECLDTIDDGEMVVSRLEPIESFEYKDNELRFL